MASRRVHHEADADLLGEPLAGPLGDDDDDDLCVDCCPCLSFCSCFSCMSSDKLCGRYDGCGVFCSGLTWLVLLFCSHTVLTILEDLNPFVRVAYAACVLLALASHAMAMFSDPGFMPRGLGKDEWAEIEKKVRGAMEDKLAQQRDEALEEAEGAVDNSKSAESAVRRRRTVISDSEIAFKSQRAVERYRRKVRYCNICETFKPDGAHHCSVCGRCVRRMDHHCPWVNNCVGEANLRFFLLFLLYVFIAATFSLVLFAYRSSVVLYSPVRESGRQGLKSPWPILACVLSVLLCGFFAVYVVAMSCDQYEAITTGIPGIDAIQGAGENEDLSVAQGVRKYVCPRGKCRLVALLPVPLGDARPNSKSE